MKKILAVALTLALTLTAFAACAETKETLTMATNASFPPYEYVEGDQVVGIDPEIAAAVCERYQLYTHKARRAHQFERNIQFFVEYLVDTGLVEMESRRGALYYRPARQQPPADCIFPSAVLK